LLIGELHRESGTPLLAAYPTDLLMKIRNRAVYDLPAVCYPRSLHA
jgi:hypothetical protein